MDAGALLANIQLLPVVVIEDETVAPDLAQALLNAGIGAIEVTLRTDEALGAIERIAREVPDILVGAGSIRRAGQFDTVEACGAHFAVSPGATDELLESAQQKQMPFVPGAVTPSEIIRLLTHGYHLQKFFPAEQSGGLPRLKAMSAPLPEVSFMPTGGINAQLARDYLAAPFVSCVGGSWFVSQETLKNRDFRQIEADARAALDAINN